MNVRHSVFCLCLTSLTWPGTVGQYVGAPCGADGYCPIATVCDEGYCRVKVDADCAPGPESQCTNNSVCQGNAGNNLGPTCECVAPNTERAGLCVSPVMVTPLPREEPAVEAPKDFRWKSFLDLPPGSTVEVCEGKDFVLPWRYAMSGDHIRVINVVWNFAHEGGEGETLLASYVQGKFLVPDDIPQKLSFLPNAGLVLSSATPAVSGNYSVTVHLNLEGAHVFDSLSVHVDVTDECCESQLRLLQAEVAGLKEDTRTNNDVPTECVVVWKDEVGLAGQQSQRAMATNSSDLAQCKQACLENSKCSVISFDQSTCSLFYTTPDTVPTPGATYSTKGCKE